MPPTLKVITYSEYDFYKATQALNIVLQQKCPKTFDPLWIEQQDRDLYKYLSQHVKTETGEVDWDAVTVTLERRFQKRWYWYSRRKAIKAAPYENKEELDAILSKYQSKLYTILVPLDKEDEKIQDKILISLVRISQKGNVLAQKQTIEWLTLIINEWVENSRSIARWKGYSDSIIEGIQQCIRCYRYTGTFLGYVYKTFQYAGRGVRPLYAFSLNDKVGKGKGTKTRIDYMVQEEDS